MTGDICLRCQDILKTYSDRTRLPKFTCNVRTKFSEMSIFADIPPGTGVSKMQISIDSLYRLSRSLKIDQENQHFPVTAEDSINDIVATLFVRCKSLLDILEPLHWRQSIRPSGLVRFWSYSLSMVRWKDSICLFKPDLQGALDFFENCHRYMHTSFLGCLDSLLSSGEYFVAVVLLNAWYEGISAMEDTSLVNISAKEHLLSSLTHHLLHVYRVLLPLAPDKSQRKNHVETLAFICNWFSETLDLMPERWQIHQRGFWMRFMLKTREKLSLLEEKLDICTGNESSRDSRQQSERPVPLKAYFPSDFLELFGLSTNGQHSPEAGMHECILSYPPSLQEELRGLCHWNLGVGLGVFSHLCANDAENTSAESKLLILDCIKAASSYAWDKAIHICNRSFEQDGLTVSDLMAFRNIIEGFMIEWVEEMSK